MLRYILESAHFLNLEKQSIDTFCYTYNMVSSDLCGSLAKSKDLVLYLSLASFTARYIELRTEGAPPSLKLVMTLLMPLVPGIISAYIGDSTIKSIFNSYAQNQIISAHDDLYQASQELSLSIESPFAHNYYKPDKTLYSTLLNLCDQDDPSLKLLLDEYNTRIDTLAENWNMINITPNTSSEYKNSSIYEIPTIETLELWQAVNTTGISIIEYLEHL